ncbi:hypothetical protein CFP56_003110 [Quercus suber]|uniref:Uncharacterized protein n=1 Tax=Quercus suber TaxID=58331 RepID=A0AAW0LEF6_QUESU
MEVDSCIQIAPTQNQTAEVASRCFSGNHFGNADVSHNAQFTCPKSRNFRETAAIVASLADRFGVRTNVIMTISTINFETNHK